MPPWFGGVSVERGRRGACYRGCQSACSSHARCAASRVRQNAGRARRSVARSRRSHSMPRQCQLTDVARESPWPNQARRPVVHSWRAHHFSAQAACMILADFLPAEFSSLPPRRGDIICPHHPPRRISTPRPPSAAPTTWTVASLRPPCVRGERVSTSADHTLARMATGYIHAAPDRPSRTATSCCILCDAVGHIVRYDPEQTNEARILENLDDSTRGGSGVLTGLLRRRNLISSTTLLSSTAVVPARQSLRTLHCASAPPHSTGSITQPFLLTRPALHCRCCTSAKSRSQASSSFPHSLPLRRK